MSIGLKGNVDGSGAVQVGGSDAITISTGLNTTFAGTVTSSTGALYPLSSGTAVASTSGTSIDFTGIPSTAKRITVMFSGVSLSGTSNPLIQIGAVSVTTSGYLGSGSGYQTTASGATSNYTTGFGIQSGAAANVLHGAMVLTNVSGNTWSSSHSIGLSGTSQVCTGGGSITLAGVLDRVRITTVNGTDLFDAGSINIMWE